MTASDNSACFETLCAEVDVAPASITRPLAMPIVTSAVFDVPSLEAVDDLYEGRAEGFIYTRDGNPNQAVLGALVARLEGAEDGVAAASGMAAIAAGILPGLKQGDRVVASHDLYGKTAALLRGPLAALGVQTEFLDLTDEAAAEQALRRPAAVVIVESIANPLLRVPEIARLAELAHGAGARLVVDNTFATPYHCRPLALGADVVVHSGTKYFGGHSDLTIGVLVADATFVALARNTLSTFGSSASPFDCWLTARGIKTLALRMERASANAQRVAEYLLAQPEVLRVEYPGLPKHPQHARAAAQFERGFGAMVTFELRGGEAAASRFVKGLRRIRFAPSLADVSTTLSHPAKTSHRGYSAAQREALGITGGMIRLSVGIEHTDDITADLRVGLDCAAAR